MANVDFKNFETIHNAVCRSLTGINSNYDVNDRNTGGFANAGCWFQHSMP